MGKNKTIFIPQFGISYIEGEHPVYLQIYALDDGELSVGFVVAHNDDEATQMGSVYGQILMSQRLTSMFSKLAMFLKVDKTIEDS
jgi:hypothetical protein